MTELEQFVASLAIPADRKAIVLAELTDHMTCATEAAVREGRDPEAAARAAIGNFEALRRSLEAVEPAFRITRKHAWARGLVAGLANALVIDQAGTGPWSAVGALVAIAIAGLFAPPHALALLRAELRATRIRGTFGARGVPIGPVIIYAFTVMYTPMLVWIGMIVVRARAGMLTVDLPVSAFAVMAAVLCVLFVEGVRARRKAMV